MIMSHSVYAKTATKSKKKNVKRQKIYAFGRNDELHGQDISKGGYSVWALSENYDGKVRGGIRKSWGYIELDMSYNDAVKLMNRRLGYKAFEIKS